MMPARMFESFEFNALNIVQNFDIRAWYLIRFFA